jgi:type IV pilus assembly protein PilA
MTEYLAHARTENDSQRKITMLAGSPEEAERLIIDEARAKNYRLDKDKDTDRVKLYALVHLERKTESRHAMASASGFSLIELLIVVAIILIIAAIAIPNLLRSRMTANEASAVGSLRTINTSAVTYSVTFPDTGFPPSIAALGGTNPCTSSAASACLLDAVLAAGTKSGYSFVLTGDGMTPSVGYSVTALPVTIGTTGQRAFCTDQSAVIRYTVTGSGCTVASPPLQ